VIELYWGIDWPSPEAPSIGPIGVRGLEIGGGPYARRLNCRQFDAIDWSKETGLSYDIGDARELPYEDESFEYVFVSNLLEHFSQDETILVLAEWTRVLVHGGVLELVVPDALEILRTHFRGVDSWPHCEERLRGTRDYPGNEHHNAFTLAEFPAVVASVPDLLLHRCESCHAGCGVYALLERR